MTDESLFYLGMITCLKEGYPFFYGNLKLSYCVYSRKITKHKEDMIIAKIEPTNLFSTYSESEFLEEAYGIMNLIMEFGTSNIDAFEIELPMRENAIIHADTFQIDFDKITNDSKSK